MGKTKIKLLFFIFALLFSTLFLNACSVNFNSSNKAETANTSNKVELLDASISVEYTQGLGYYVTVVGNVKNNSKKNYVYCSITFNIYNESGAKIGQCIDNTNYLGSGETWQFKALSFEWFDYQGTYTAKCVDITYF